MCNLIESEKTDSAAVNHSYVKNAQKRSMSMSVFRLEGCPDGHCCRLLDNWRKMYESFRRVRTAGMKALSRTMNDDYIPDTDKVAYCREWLARYYADMIK